MPKEVVPRYSKRVHGPPLPFALKHYPGISRGKLQVIDPYLVDVLRGDKEGYAQIPKVLRDLSDPIAVWREKHPSTRLKQLHKNDLSLRQAITKGVNEGTITAEDIARREAEMHMPPVYTQQYREDFVAYARAYYPGATQNSLARDNWNLFVKIRDAGRLNEFPRV
jgi:hypothetical protein